ncbi:MAG: TIGR03560 family F420-dependent LLM class oxidoreductase [Omnitrophica WOR_2 bacterium]
MDKAIMIEGQNGLNWPRWKKIVELVEDLGYSGLFRSDHYTNGSPPDTDSLELWISLTWLADHTRRIQFGPLVTPMSFRNPTITARMASAVDDLSGGRLVLGLGAGWQEREHRNFGWDLLDGQKRFDRFEEGLEVITRLLNRDQPSNFEGEYYHLEDAILLPRPQRPGGPPILIGGNGKNRTLELVARYASEWNAVYLPPEEFSRMNALLDRKLLDHGRRAEEVRRSLMTGVLFGRDSADVERKAKERTQGQGSPQSLRQRGMIAGTGDEINVQLANLEQAGVQRVMLQWLDLDDLQGLEELARAIL